MEAIKIEKRTTPYAFQKYIDENKHLDTDELRHTIKPVIHVVINDCKGEEHKFCDREQLDVNGKFRRPKKLMEAEQKGYKSVYEMVDAEKKAVEDEKEKKIDALTALVQDQKKLLDFLMAKLQ